MYIAITPFKTITVDSLLELSYQFNVVIMDGSVYLDNELDTISYDTDDYTEIEIRINFANNRLTTLLKREGITVYKAEPIN